MRGGQWQVLHLLRGLRDRGFDLRLLARGPLLERALDEGFEAASISMVAVAAAGAAGFDIVHAHDAKSHTWASPFGRGKLVVSRRVIFPVKQTLLSGWKYGQAARYIAISQAVATELVKAGVPPGKIDVVYDGVPVPERVIPYEDRPLDRYLCVVKDVPKPDPALGLQFPVLLADEVLEARGLVYLSGAEGLGSAALVAMAHAVPVIASRTGGLPEAVEDGVTGVLIDGLDAGPALAALRADPERAARMGLAGRERVLRMFAVDTMVNGTVKVYEKVK
jgi:hypothetical protein